MVKNIEACEWLTSAIKNLEASNMDPCYVKLRAVRSLFFICLDAYLAQTFSLNSFYAKESRLNQISSENSICWQSCTDLEDM